MVRALAIVVVVCCLTISSCENSEVSEATGLECVSKQEFDSLKNDLRYYWNLTLTLIKNNKLRDEEYKESFEHSIESLKEDIKECVNDSLSAIMASAVSSIEEKLANCSNTQTIDEPMIPDSFPVGSFSNPAASCKNIALSNKPSGYYWIQSTSTCYATKEYCEMSPPCTCDVSSGWMRVADLDMTNSNEHCPPGLTFETIASNSFCSGTGSRCTSVIFPVNSVRYGKVCGKIIGYQYYSMDAFARYYYDRSRTIDDLYVDGISLTHGTSPRSHIWTFVNAIDEVHSNVNVCPCTKTDTPYTGVVPPFIDNDYFCDTGSHNWVFPQWYTADPLWDGEGCGETSTCCDFNSPPWFCKELQQSTTDDIEMRICFDESSGENIGVESVNIFVQ